MAAYTTIDDPSAYFKVQLYTGNGSANHAITFDDTDTDMQPDFVWIKNRDTSDSHCLFDAARGATKVIHSDTSGGESTDADTLDSFTSDGFQVDADDKVNTNTEKYVAWCWSAGTGAGSSNTTGTINTTTTSVNTTSKFSISTYTGNDTAGGNFGHGMGAVPHTILIQSREGDTWRVYHHKNTAAPETDYLKLDTSAATVDSATAWNDTAPSSTIITLGTSGNLNESAHTYISYAWSGVQGFSKFGGYTGNANADGPFIYLGFKPAFFMLKRNLAAFNYYMSDNKRFTGSETANPAHSKQNADESAADEVHPVIDFLSNGVKIRSTDTTVNAAVTHVYWAFAEAPFVNSSGVPNNAE